jgi:RNA polymerase sigma factor (sigma-70 family)
VGSLALYTGDRDLAEELAQEALLRAVQRWARLRDLESPSAWAHRVGFNLAKSAFRRRLALRRANDRQRVVVPLEPDVASDLAVRAAVAALPEAQRQAVILRYFADLSVREVAAIVGCPENTVKTNTRRAIEALRTADLGNGPVETNWYTSGGTA